jgi:2-keto-4-pentenoate hydratase/2-oxohepta-3-ene-1,7-dioic acid hydratase in catechol pathway
MAMKPQVWLKSGDVVRIEVTGIGALENTVEE